MEDNILNLLSTSYGAEDGLSFLAIRAGLVIRNQPNNTELVIDALRSLIKKRLLIVIWTGERWLYQSTVTKEQ